MTVPDASVPTFGQRGEGVEYLKRTASYAIIRNREGAVAVVRGKHGWWLPGGGGVPGETAEETLVREVREELAREPHILGRIGEAIQFFHAHAEATYYEMRAVFFAVELGDALAGNAEYEVNWLDVRGPELLFYHPCHDWAVRQQAKLNV